MDLSVPIRTEIDSLLELPDTEDELHEHIPAENLPGQGLRAEVEFTPRKPKKVLGGPANRSLAHRRKVAGIEIKDELHIAVAMGDELVFITGYWKNDRPRRKRMGSE